MSTRQPLYTAITKGKQTADQSQSSTDVSSKIKVADTPTTLTSSHHGEYSGAINVNFNV